jgi:glutamate dehydrogenase (NADP+)
MSTGLARRQSASPPAGSQTATPSSASEVPCSVALPCATQNELTGRDAERLIANGVGAVGEGANMPCTPEAIRAFRTARVAFAPGKAANAGGVAASALEMQQNASRDSWASTTPSSGCARSWSRSTPPAGTPPPSTAWPGDYLAGANIAGFTRVADAMLALGLI